MPGKPCKSINSDTDCLYVIEIILATVIFIWVVWSLGDFVAMICQGNINGEAIGRSYEIFWLLKLFGKFFLVLVILFVRAISNQIETKQLRDVFFQDCAPYKMYDILVLWEAFVKKGDVRNDILMLKAQCCRYIPGLLNTLLGKENCLVNKVVWRMELARLDLEAKEWLKSIQSE